MADEKYQLNEARRREGVGLTDPATGFSISRDQQKPLPKRTSATLRGWIRSGVLVPAGKSPAKNAGAEEPLKNAGTEEPPKEKKGIFKRGK